MRRVIVEQRGAGYIGLVCQGSKVVDVLVFGPHIPFSQVGKCFKGRILQKGIKENTYFVQSPLPHQTLVSGVKVPLSEGAPLQFQVTHDLNLKEPHKGYKGRYVTEEVVDSPSDWLEDALKRMGPVDQILHNSVPLALLLKEKGADVPLVFKSSAQLFEEEGVQERFEELLSSDVLLDGGGSMTLETTHVGVCVDVNTSSNTSGTRSSVKKVNGAALKQLVEEIPLRALTGLILVDFVEFEKRADQFHFLETLKKEMALIGGSVLGYTRGGLVEITRPRKGYSLQDLMAFIKENA